jgi:DHA1 family bicyclomycin/chloramphenicol resistance-like MFS transporter
MFSRLGKKNIPFVEFVVIISMMMSLTALSIDAMLPALQRIGLDLGVPDSNSRQLVVSTMFLGLGIGQLFFGPLSDKIGRKPTVFWGYAIYILGALLAWLASDFSVLLAGRFLQGIGGSSPRAVTMAIARDRYEGRQMARVMSIVMTVFILVPMIAPSMGQAVLLISSWRGIFISFIVIAGVTLIWFLLRMPETLAKEDVAPFSLQRIWSALLVIVNNRTAIGYTISAGLISGAFLGYLNSSQQIFQEQYGLGERFPLVFAIISLSIGLASSLNARLVMRLGMRFMVKWSMILIIGLAVIGMVISLSFSGNPPFGFLLGYIILTFFCIGILFGNQNAIAMEPLGHLAGIGAAVVGSLGTLLQVILGTIIGQSYNGTVIPLIMGLLVLTGSGLLVVLWVERKKV